MADSLPDGFEDEVTEMIATSGVSIQRMRLPGGPFAGVDLYLPPAVGYFIMAAYFGGFVGEAGKDGYNALKRGSRELWRKVTSLNVRQFGSPGKIRSTGYSIAFALGCEIHSSLRVKLLIPESASEDEVEQATAAFLELMTDLHAGSLSAEKLQALFPYAPMGGTVLMTFDAKAGMIVPVDGLAETVTRTSRNAPERSATLSED